MSNHYSGLASAVLVRAFEDMVGDAINTFTTDSKAYRRREKWRVEAREFLTTDNDTLRMWCVIGGLDMKAIVERSKSAAEEWDKKQTEIVETTVNPS